MDRKDQIIMSTAKERMLEIDELLDQYEVNVGLPKFQEQYNEDVSKYLNLTRVELAALSAQDCAEISFLLSKCSLHLTRAINRENGRVHWAGGSLTELIAKNKYNGFYEAIKNDEAGMKLLKIKNYASHRAERLKYVATAVNRMADLLIELKRSKEKENNV